MKYSTLNIKRVLYVVHSTAKAMNVLKKKKKKYPLKYINARIVKPKWSFFHKMKALTSDDVGVIRRQRISWHRS